MALTRSSKFAASNERSTLSYGFGLMVGCVGPGMRTESEIGSKAYTVDNTSRFSWVSDDATICLHYIPQYSFLV